MSLFYFEERTGLRLFENDARKRRSKSRMFAFFSRLSSFFPLSLSLFFSPSLALSLSLLESLAARNRIGVRSALFAYGCARARVTDGFSRLSRSVECSWIGLCNYKQEIADEEMIAGYGIF